MRRIGLLIVAVTAASGAAADIYKCTDKAGHVTYSNVAAKGCERIVVGGDSSADTAPAKGPKGGVSTPTPANFPKVDGTTQRARDDDRRRILDSELAAEQKHLAEAKAALVEQEGLVLPTERIVGGGIKGAAVEERLKTYRDRVALHERNLEALRKEIGNLK